MPTTSTELIKSDRGPQPAERNAILAERYENGEPLAQLAADMGLSVGSAKNILSARGATRKASARARDLAIASAIRAGEAPNAVAARLGVSISLVRRVAKERTA